MHEAPKLPRTLQTTVVVAGVAVGAIFGSFVFPLGTGLGALGGLVAAWVWLSAASRSIRRGRPVAGTLWGVLAGLIATFVLHAGLWFTVGSLDTEGFPVQGFVWTIAVVCGIVAGAVMGAICKTELLRSGQPEASVWQDSEADR